MPENLAEFKPMGGSSPRPEPHVVLTEDGSEEITVLPQGSYCLIQRLPPETHRGGILIPEQAREMKRTAHVRTIGPDVKHLQVGGEVFFQSYATLPTGILPPDYMLVKERDITAIIQREPKAIVQPETGSGKVVSPLSED